MFVEVTGEKLVGRAVCPPILNRVKTHPFLKFGEEFQLPPLLVPLMY